MSVSFIDRKLTFQPLISSTHTRIRFQPFGYKITEIRLTFSNSNRRSSDHCNCIPFWSRVEWCQCSKEWTELCRKKGVFIRLGRPSQENDIKDEKAWGHWLRTRLEGEQSSYLYCIWNLDIKRQQCSVHFVSSFLNMETLKDTDGILGNDFIVISAEISLQLITILIGQNDLCLLTCNQNSSQVHGVQTAKMFAANVRRALDRLAKDVPKSFVNLVLPAGRCDTIEQALFLGTLFSQRQMFTSSLLWQ